MPGSAPADGAGGRTAPFFGGPANWWRRRHAGEPASDLEGRKEQGPQAARAGRAMETFTCHRRQDKRAPRYRFGPRQLVVASSVCAAGADRAQGPQLPAQCVVGVGSSRGLRRRINPISCLPGRRMGDNLSSRIAVGRPQAGAGAGGRRGAGGEREEGIFSPGLNPEQAPGADPCGPG